MKSVIKKLMTVLIIIVMLLSFAACAKKDEGNVVGKVHYKVEYHDEILYEDDIEVNNQSVYDLLEVAKLEYDMNNSIMGVYISSLCGHAEKEEGAMSGWEYFVNDKPGTVACDKYICKDKDNILWKYAYEK